MSAWQNFINGFDFQPLLEMLMFAVPALICITLHELSHGYVACRLGDTTAKDAGRLTLNPIRHLDIVGFLMLIVAHVGWAKPVPVNMYRFENPKRGMAITALAGPVSNFIITAVSIVLYCFFYPLVYSRTSSVFLLDCFDLLYYTAYLSLGLGLFNLLPIPPLDGSKVLFALLPDSAYAKLMRYERYGMILLIALAYFGVTGQFLSSVIGAVFERFLDLGDLFFRWGCSLFLA
ncbi:MAG: site-2 protease family protein [Oscillospiraceae bacterium]|nr:site-2 protease family protein [Oscillospiraceae bacterium]